MKRMMQTATFDSWKTTLAGLVAMLAIIFPQLGFMFDGDPETAINWNTIVAAISVFVTGLMARDNDVTSEQAGANVK